jgi:hypothetical protein
VQRTNAGEAGTNETRAAAYPKVHMGFQWIFQEGGFIWSKRHFTKPRQIDSGDLCAAVVPA